MSTRELRQEIVHDAMAIIEAEFDRPLTVAEVAGRVATSPRQLHRAFSECAQGSFGHCLLHVRMTHAADLLRATDVPVREVAARVGYRHVGQFTKTFKRTFGQTPGRYRR